MKLISDNFKDNELMIKTYTCDGKDISPHIKWEEVPADTKSLALTCIDPDAPGGSFIHWLICNIPKAINSIPEAGPLPEQAKEIENDFGKVSYGGPCPPSGTHRYIFTLYALNVERIDNINKSNFAEKVQEHKIDSCTLMGLYKRK